jgi:hypothetical protein
MPEYTVVVEADKTIFDLLVLKKNIEQAALELVSRAANALIADLAATAPQRTGTLSRSFTQKTFGINVDNLFVAEADVFSIPYWSFPEFGTGIRGEVPPASGELIRPKRARFLRWIEGGRVHYARFTRGQFPKRFVRKSLENLESRLPGIAVLEVEKNLRVR